MHEVLNASAGPAVSNELTGGRLVLAAASLHDLGLTAATGLAGGFQAWAAAGLPVVSRP